MIDQRELWDTKHAADEHAKYRGGPMTFARNVEPFFPRQAEVLDLGCGVAGDAYFFAQRGHHVTATDFSKTVIEQDKALLLHPNLSFSVLDMTGPLSFPTSSIDVVYAHLSLHYYDHETTAKVFDEIARFLKPNGLFCFACKSTKDSDYGQGEEIAPDIFVSSKGHVRHFFTPDYATQLLSHAFVVQSLEEVTEYYVDKSASFIRCVARRIIK